jgi:hypothetical protein
MGYLWLFCRLPAVTYGGESIFEQNYIREQEAKIEFFQNYVEPI